MKVTRSGRLWVFMLWMECQRPKLNTEDRDRWCRLYTARQLDRREESDFHEWVRDLSERSAQIEQESVCAKS